MSDDLLHCTGCDRWLDRKRFKLSGPNGSRERICYECKAGRVDLNRANDAFPGVDIDAIHRKWPRRRAR